MLSTSITQPSTSPFSSMVLLFRKWDQGSSILTIAPSIIILVMNAFPSKSSKNFWTSFMEWLFSPNLTCIPNITKFGFIPKTIFCTHTKATMSSLWCSSTFPIPQQPYKYWWTKYFVPFFGDSSFFLWYLALQLLSNKPPWTSCLIVSITIV